MMSGDSCEDAGGDYAGDGTNCRADCDDGGEGEGACCVGSECVVTTEERCRARRGRYLGDDTECTRESCGR